MGREAGTAVTVHLRPGRQRQDRPRFFHRRESLKRIGGRSLLQRAAATGRAPALVRDENGGRPERGAGDCDLIVLDDSEPNGRPSGHGRQSPRWSRPGTSRAGRPSSRPMTRPATWRSDSVRRPDDRPADRLAANQGATRSGSTVPTFARGPRDSPRDPTAADRPAAPDLPGAGRGEGAGEGAGREGEQAEACASLPAVVAARGVRGAAGDAEGSRVHRSRPSRRRPSRPISSPRSRSLSRSG